MSSKPVYVLGTGLSHDGSACLLKDGVIAVAIEKERITRRKHDGFNDREAIAYCLNAEGISLDDVALVVQNANLGMFARGGNDWFHGPRDINAKVPVISISHHLAHAYSAVGPSPFEEAAVMVIDGCGNNYADCIDLEGAVIPEKPEPGLGHLYFEKDSYYQFGAGTLRPVYKDFSCWGYGFAEYPLDPNTSMHSIGGTYLGASKYVFNGMEDPGKLMGLAPYGRPGVFKGEIFDLKDGRVFVRYDWMDRFDRPSRSHDQFKADFQYYADFAYWIQREIERAIVYVMRSRYEIAPCDNLCYAGGVALNAVANRRILRETPFRRIFIQPAAGDNGLAVGCAYYGWLEVLKKSRTKSNGSVFLGARYSDAAVQQAFEKYSGSVSVKTPDDWIGEAAELLASGKVLAWFQGGAEFGPRALGNRSILADPRRPEKRDFINSRVKLREDFRPFAPSVLQEFAHIYFDCDYDSPHMLLVAPVRPEWREKIPSVVHLDGSARIQTVTEEANPAYYKLLRRFYDLTGVAVLLNTSLNRRKMPIVERPAQAIDFFLGCELDALVVHQYIVRKTPIRQFAGKSLPRLFFEDIRVLLDRRQLWARNVGGVYHVNVSGKYSWTIDLSKTRPVVSEGLTHTFPDAIVEMSEADFRVLRNGAENGIRDWIETGRVRVDGNSDAAKEFLELLRPV